MTRPRIVFVGEAFGHQEARFQHALVGKSGIEFAYQLHNIDLAPGISMFCPTCKTRGVYPECDLCKRRFWPNELDMIRHWKLVREQHSIEITNVFQEHPPENQIGYFFTDDAEARDNFMPPVRFNKDQKGRWVQPQHRHHLERLWQELRDTNPNLIVCLGNCASWALLKETGIGAIRGTVTTSPIVGIKCLPTYHPAGVLRQWRNRPIVLADLAKAKVQSEFAEIRRTRRRITFAIEYSEYLLSEIEKWLSLPADEYTIDVESGYILYTKAELNRMTKSMRHILSSQLSIIGFSRSSTDAMNITFMTKNSPDLSFWPTPELEHRAWELASVGLMRPIPKIFQNGIYDLTRLMFAGRRISMPRYDTMLHHHSLYPELLKGLGFLGSIYADEAAWKLSYRLGELKRDA